LPLARTRILYWILTPVLGVGVLIAVVAVRFSEPALAGLFISRAESSLQLASRMAFTACENSFNYLLDLRLEGDLELNDTLRRETLEEIRSIRDDFEGIELFVLDGAGQIVGASGALGSTPLSLATMGDLPTAEAGVRELWGETFRVHARYFPFWDWQVVSAVREDNVLAPLRSARRAVIAGLAGGILLLVGTLYGVFRHLVDRPLRRLAQATAGVVDGRYARVPKTREDEIGQVVGAFNAMVDALEAKEADVRNLVTELRTSEDRFRTLFESSPVGIGLLDAQGSMLESNGAMLGLMGRSTEETEHLPLAELFRHPAEGQALLARLGKGEVVRSQDVELLRSDGTPYSARITATQLQVGGQQATLVLAEDVTREKRLQESLERARKMEALGTLAGGVAHDLNNILSGVVGYPELMLIDLPSDSPLIKPVQAIKNSGERAVAIVQDLLTLARRGVATTTVVSLNRVVEEYLGSPEFEKLRHHHRNVRVQTRLADDLLNVRGAPVHLAKTVMNLVSNAAEAMPGGVPSPHPPRTATWTSRLASTTTCARATTRSSELRTPVKASLPRT